MTAPNYAVWPTPADVWAVLAASGLMAAVATGQDPPAPLNALPWQQWCDAPVSELEEATDRRPYLGTTTTIDVSTSSLTDRGFDPWGRGSRYLALPSPMLSVSTVTLFSSVIFGQTSNPAGGGGLALVPWQDFRLEPTSAPGRHAAYTGMAFFWGHGPGWPGEQGVIRIVGSQGQAATIPAHIWTMVLQLAVCAALPSVEQLAIQTTLGAEAALGQRIRVQTEEVMREVGAGRADPFGMALYRPGSPGHTDLLRRWRAALRINRKRVFA